MDPAKISALMLEVDEAEQGGSQTVPAFEPLDDGNAIVRSEVRFQAGSEDVPGVAKPVEVEMVQREATVTVLLDQGERGGLDAARDPQSAGDAFHELGLAGPQVAGQSEDPTGLSGEPKAFPEFDRFPRAM